MSKFSKTLVGMTCLSCILPFFARAETDSPLEVNVYANRYSELAYENPNTQVISRQQIESTGAKTLFQVLRGSAYIGTLSTVSGNERDGAITMDGYGENAGQNVLILVDGQPLNSPTLETVDLGLIPLETVEQIEITPGAGTIKYGRSAVAGVIHIKTKKAIFSETSVATSIGSFNQRDLFVSTGKRLGDFSGVRFTASRETSDNFRDNSATDVSQGKFEFRTRKGMSDLAYAYTRTLTDQELPGYVPLNSSPTKAGSPYDDSNDRFYKHEISLSRRLSDSSGIFIGANYRESNQVADYVSMTWTQRQTTTSKEFIADYYKNFDLGRLSSGIQSSSVRFDDNYKPGNQDVKSLYLNQIVNLSDKNQLSIGYRLFDVDERKDSGETNAIQRGASALAFNHKLSDTTSAFVKAEQSARFTTIDENGSTSGADFLEPQTGITYESGINFASEINSLNLSYFESNLHNEIFYDAVNYVNENLPDSKRSGLRLSGSYQASETLSLGGSMVLVNAKRTSGLYQGKDVPYVPAKRITAYAKYNLSDTVAFYFDAQHTGSQYTLNDHPNNSPKVDSFTVANTSIAWEFNDIKLNLRTSNLFNTKYSAYAVTPSATYPGAGRATSLTLRYTF